MSNLNQIVATRPTRGSGEAAVPDPMSPPITTIATCQSARSRQVTKGAPA